MGLVGTGRRRAVLVLAGGLAALFLMAFLVLGAAGSTPAQFQHGRANDTRVMGVTDGRIPTPLIDGAFSYLGNGHFTRSKGPDFYWRAGHFVNPDGSPLQVPQSIQQKLREKGFTGELTQPSFP